MIATTMPAGALAGVAAALTDGRTSGGEATLFWVLAPIMVLAALSLLFARKAIYAALGVVAVMISLAFLYVAQEAPFLGVVQVVVYTGAIMMLFLFVLMLVGVDASDSLTETLRGQRWIGVLFGLGLGVLLVTVVTQATYPVATGLDVANTDTNPVGVARLIFGNFIFAFEVVGVLLVTAALGALVLTHRQRLTPHVGQKERADARVAAGGVLAPLPAPGVYARSNAMDVPALDPTGAPIDISVSRVLRVRGQERGAAAVAAQLEPGGAFGAPDPSGAAGALPGAVGAFPASPGTEVTP